MLGYLKLTLYLQHPCIWMDLGHNKGQKRSKCRRHIDGRPTCSRKWPFLVFGPSCGLLWLECQKIGRQPQYTIIFDICSVFLKILIFVARTRDFRVSRVRPAADLRATSRPWKLPHKLFSRFFFTITHQNSKNLKSQKIGTYFFVEKHRKSRK